MKGGCMHSTWSANEMPRHIVAFAHVHAWQVAIHVAVDVPHFVTSAESGINLETRNFLEIFSERMVCKEIIQEKRIKQDGATLTIPLKTSLNLFSL